MSVLLPNGRQYYTNNAGLPLAAGRVFTYDTGTNNPRQTTSDAAGLVPNANPVILDARGEATIFWNGAYRVQVQDSLGNIVIPAIDGISTALAIVGSLIPPLDNTYNLGSPTFSWANLYLGINHAPVLDTVSGNIGYYARTAAEIAAGVTPTNFSFSPFNVIDVRRYGAVADGLPASATANSTAIQAAVNVAYAAGGGVVQFQAGTYCVNAVPIVYNTVSIRGMGRFTTFIQKTTALASTVNDTTVRRWDSAVVGFPVCCMHFVHHDGVNNWSDGMVSDIGCLADTTSPNTATTIYGFFFRGVSGGVVTRTFSRYCQVGYFWAGGSCLDSEFSFNQAADTQRGFYNHFTTSLAYFANFANKFRFAGHYASFYYSQFFSNAADNSGNIWKVGTAEIALTYEFNGCKGGSFHGNGCETHSGSVWKFTNCIGTRFENNHALDISSNYTGGLDIVLLELNGNVNCEYYNNRAQTTGMTGTAGRHFIWKVTAETLPIWERNRFVAAVADTTDTSTWANTSGAIVETQPMVFSDSFFVGTLTGCATAPTINVFWSRSGNLVELTFTNLTAVSTSVACTITGMPASIRPLAQQIVGGARIMDNSVVAFGLVIVELTGVLTLGVGATAAAFTAANNKGIQQCTIAYRIS